jgi:hypothetical protein
MFRSKACPRSNQCIYFRECAYCSSLRGLAGLCWPNTIEDAKCAFNSNNYAVAAQLCEKAQKESPACDTLLFLGSRATE